MLGSGDDYARSVVLPEVMLDSASDDLVDPHLILRGFDLAYGYSTPLLRCNKIQDLGRWPF
jgi:hypothetical protein